MKNHRKIITLLIISFSLTILMISCSEDENLVEPDVENQYAKINNFIEENMSIYYFWNEDMPDLDPEKENDPEIYFDKLLKDPDDKWSFITDDYQGLVNYFAGIQKSTGYSLLPMYFKEGSNQVIAYIEYVHKNTPAEDAGLKRGDMIYKIDGQEMTDQNFSDLLSRNKFDITLGHINSDNEINELTPIVPIEAIEINLHPIIASTVIDTLGHKIGYLAYSSFIYDYNDDLEKTFAQLKSEGITDMVLDLRYNGGGSVNSAGLMGDMLVPRENEGNVFIERVYNDLLTNAFEQDTSYTADDFILSFKENANNLNLENLYVLTTPSTASASEMIIYGLEPYMNVIQIGGTTHGKYYASTTLSEEDEHNWAIQPIIYRSINSTDDINYLKGLSPDHELEDLFYLFPPFQLGDPDEFFMAKAISAITGEPFIYQEIVDQIDALKTRRKINETRYKLRNELYPKRSEMWVEP